jgi:hypothetical protein
MKRYVHVGDVRMDLFSKMFESAAGGSGRSEREALKKVKNETFYYLLERLEVDDDDLSDIEFDDRKMNRASVSRVLDRMHAEPLNAQLVRNYSALIRHRLGSAMDRRLTPRSDVNEVGRGGGSVVMEAVIPARDGIFPSTAFVTKIPVTDSGRLDALNEMYIGLFALNPLRDEIPNFMFVHDCFLAPGVSSDGIIFGGTDGVDVPHLVLERVTGGDLDIFYQFCNINGRVDIVHSILAQVILALAVAQDRCDFSHNDMHYNNVKIRELPEEVEIVYRFTSGPAYILKTKYIAKVIDFGRSHARIEVTRPPAKIQRAERAFFSGSTFTLGAAVPSIGVGPHAENDSLFDVLRLIESAARLSCDPPEDGGIVYNKTVLAWIDPLFARPISAEDDADIAKWANQNYPRPAVTVSLRELFDTVYRKSDFDFVRRISESTAHDMKLRRENDSSNSSAAVPGVLGDVPARENIVFSS